jgi:transcriptional regulator with XRE-family HTH domain
MAPVHLGRIKELRGARDWSQAELAERAGIRRATLADIESGKTKGIDFATLEAIANALGVDAGFLIVHEKQPRDR